jgi:monofunctional biosynthetic peptidoglycan transglycosylase
MLWRYGEALGQGEWDYRLHYQWRDLDRMAPSLPISLVAAEDQRFPVHNGFDLQAIEKARDHNAKGGRLRGASTISQQVAKNLFLWQGRSWVRKGLEVWYTVLIEALWPKSRILEVYANIAEFGDGIYGAQAAARQYWGKDAARLSPAESARLAAVLPAPRRYNAAKPGPFVQRRAAWIQRQARQLGGTAYLADD